MVLPSARQLPLSPDWPVLGRPEGGKVFAGSSGRRWMWIISRICSLDGAPVFHQEMRLHIQSGSCLTKDGALCVHDHLK